MVDRNGFVSRSGNTVAGSNPVPGSNINRICPCGGTADTTVLGTVAKAWEFESLQGYHILNGPVAQLGEQPPCTGKAAGSTPVGSTNFNMKMFEDIDEYIKRPLEERQSHLRLVDPCIEIGGNSPRFRGLLAHFVKTTIPKGQRIHLCHACNNGKCSNPVHLYWGTPKENYYDGLASGVQQHIWERVVNKYGEAKALEMARTSMQRIKGD